MPTNTIENPKIVSQDEWLGARKILLAKEKQLTHERDAIAGSCHPLIEKFAKRPAMPQTVAAVPVRKVRWHGDHAVEPETSSSQIVERFPELRDVLPLVADHVSRQVVRAQLGAVAAGVHTRHQMI